jgi:hypothetical protein
VENVERIVKHGRINLPIFCFGRWGFLVTLNFKVL